MSHTLENAIEKSIDIHAPLHTVYERWTRFEDYPRFMEGVREVRRSGEDRLHWRAIVEGQEREWDSAIVEQTPDTRIAWKNTNSPVEGGMVSFTTIYEGTRVTLQMTFDPNGLHAPIGGGDPKEALSHRVEEYLKGFKALIEAEGIESSSGRGEVHGGQVVPERASDDQAAPSRAVPTPS